MHLRMACRVHDYVLCTRKRACQGQPTTETRVRCSPSAIVYDTKRWEAKKPEVQLVLICSRPRPEEGRACLSLRQLYPEDSHLFSGRTSLTSRARGMTESLKRTLRCTLSLDTVGLCLEAF